MYINEEYNKINDIGEVADPSYNFMEAYIMTRNLVHVKINEEENKLNANQKIFTNKYNSQINENSNELGKKIKISDEVFENHTQLYLIFFKVDFTESVLLKAIEGNDVSAIQ